MTALVLGGTSVVRGKDDTHIGTSPVHLVRQGTHHVVNLRVVPKIPGLASAPVNEPYLNQYLRPTRTVSVTDLSLRHHQAPAPSTLDTTGEAGVQIGPQDRAHTPSRSRTSCGLRDGVPPRRHGTLRRAGARVPGLQPGDKYHRLFAILSPPRASRRRRSKLGSPSSESSSTSVINCSASATFVNATAFDTL